MEKASAAPLVLWRLLPTWLRGLVRTMRPTQWTKNGFIFIPILFDRQIHNLDALSRVMVAFGLFCLVSSAVYVLNDIVDAERDRLDPRKQHRAIPSGQLPRPAAIIAAIVLPVVSLGAAFAFSVPLALVMVAYYTKDLAYSFYLKNIVIVDVLVLASGFILRVLAGLVVITVTQFSPWMFVVIGMLALLLAVGKRRQEMIRLGNNAEAARSAYKEYNKPLLDDMLRMVTTGSIMAYTLYTFQAPTNLGGEWMMLTVPIAVFGIFRYLYLIHVKGEGGAPDELLFKDKPLLLTVALFVLAVGVIIYILPKMLI